MKKPNKNMVRQHLLKELFKLFSQFVENSDGWRYAKQSKYTATDVFTRLAQAALETTSLEDVCENYKGCSADTVHYRFNHLDFDQTISQINDILRYIAQGFKIHKNQKLTIAIDITDLAWYGDANHELSVGSKPKSGTYFFNRYFTACIITKTYRIPVYFLPLRQIDGVSPHRLVEAMLREIFWWCPVSRLLADSYFFSLDLFEVMKLYDLEFLFNLKINSKVKKSIQMIKDTQRSLALLKNVDCKNHREWYQWLKKNQLITFKFDSKFTRRDFHDFPVILQTVLLKKQKGRNKYRENLALFSYTTNIKASGLYLKKLYKTRWGIETQYRVTRQFRAKTCSLNTTLRIFLIGLSFVLTSLWLRFNLIINRIQSNQKNNLDYDLPLRIYRYDHLIQTVSSIKRLICREWSVLQGGDY